MSVAQRRRLALLCLGGGLLASMVAGVAIGSVTLPFSGVARSLASHAGLAHPATPPLAPPLETILWAVRLPRVLIAAVVGGGLAVAGAALQSVFRNPMADAGLLGVASGAALGAVLAIRTGLASEVFLALPAGAFAGALAAVVAVYLIAHASGHPTLHGLLLTGIAVSALGTAGTSVLLVATEEFRVKAVLFWLAGGLEGRSWPHLQIGGLVIAGAALLLLASRALDLLSLGEDEAASLGLPVHTTRLLVLGACALVTGAATAIAGTVPFVGLMAPHALRPMVGPLGRHLLPAAFLGGAILVVVADLASRSLSPRMDFPLGAVTAIVGAPYFLLALRGSAGRT
jgi:iron complex transport system permease protein